MAGPKVGKENQREIVSGLRGASAIREGSHGHAVSASVVDTIAETYRGKMQGHKPLAAKVAGAHKFDPPGMSERMAEAARAAASGNLSFRHAMRRVDEADRQSKREMQTHLVRSYRGRARELGQEAGQELRKPEMNGRELQDNAVGTRLEVGARRADLAVEALRDGKFEGKPLLDQLGGEAHAREVLARVYAGQKAIAKHDDPISKDMLTRASTGRPAQDPLSETGELHPVEARFWAVGESKDPAVKAHQEEAWGIALDRLVKKDLPTEGEVRVDLLKEKGQPVSEDIEQRLAGAKELRQDAAKLEGLDMETKEGRKGLWKHLADVDPGKMKSLVKEFADTSLFKLKTLWNSEGSVRGRIAASHAASASRAGFRTLKSLEGIAEHLMQALHSMMEMQEHAARGQMVHLAGAAWRTGRSATAAAGTPGSAAVTHASQAANEMASSQQGIRQKSQQSMGIYLARHEMAQRMGDLAQANVKEGLEVTYDYTRSFVAAAEARQKASQTKDPVERASLESASRQARKDMDVHLERLRAEHPEFHDLLKDHSMISPKQADQALEKIGNPKVAAAAQQAASAAEAGLAQGQHGDWSPVADLGALSDGRRALGAVSGDWVEVSALDATGQGESLGRIKASDFEVLQRDFNNAKKQAEHGGPAHPPGILSPDQAQGWELMDRLNAGGQRLEGVGALAQLSQKMNGQPAVLSSRNPAHTTFIQSVNDEMAKGGGQGLQVRPEINNLNEMAAVNQAVREVTYKSPMELQAFLERVVAMRKGDDEEEANEALAEMGQAL